MTPTDLMNEINSCSDEEWSDAMIATLATHPDPRFKNLANGYTDAEITEIIKKSSPELLSITELLIAEILNIIDTPGTSDKPNDSNDTSTIKNLAKQFKQIIATKEQLDQIFSEPEPERDNSHSNEFKI